MKITEGAADAEVVFRAAAGFKTVDARHHDIEERRDRA